MSIKKIITGLTLSLLLGTGVASANWGDVYYCQMTNFIQVKPNGELTNYKLEKFQFKLDQTKNAMVFGSAGYFSGSVYELTTFRNYPIRENWRANDAYSKSMTYFEEGKFMYAILWSYGMKSISADCDKF